MSETLQLRLVRYKAIKEVAEDLSAHIWEICRRHTGCCNIVPAAEEKAKQIVESGFYRQIRRYSVCGDESRCHDDICPTKWSVPDIRGRWLKHCQETHQAIFLFELPADLDGFLVDLECELFTKVCPRLSSRCWVPLKEELDTAIRKVLGPQLFNNPYCVNCPKCVPGNLME